MRVAAWLQTAIFIVSLFSESLSAGEERQKGGQEGGSCRGGKAPEKGPSHLTDELCLEMVPDAGVRRDVDGGTL